MFTRKRNLFRIKNNLILGDHRTDYKTPSQVETNTISEENKYPNVEDNPSILNVPPIIKNQKELNVPPIINDQKELIILHLAMQVFNSDSKLYSMIQITKN